jgi:hypothetical protein
MRVWTRADYLADVAARMPEAELQTKVLRLATDLGFLAYHTHDSRRSQRGWPDLVLAHPGRGRLLFRELKQQGKYPTPEQRRWLTTLEATGADVGVWRPMDLLSERVLAELRASQPTTTTGATS